MMRTTAARWTADTERLARSAASLSEVTSLVNWRCSGVALADPAEALRSICRRWADLAATMARVADEMASADSDNMSRIVAGGVTTAADAMWLGEHLGLFDSDIEDIAVAALGLAALGADLDSARDRVRSGGAEGQTDGVVSLEDLRSMASSDLFTAEQRNIAGRVLAFVGDDDSRAEQLGLKGDGGLGWAELGGMALSAAGFVPVLGDAIDAGFVAYYVAKGDWVNAASHAVGLVPLPGVSGTGVRATREAAQRLGSTLAERGARGLVNEIADETAESWLQDRVVDVSGDVVYALTGDAELAELAELASGVVLEGGFPEVRTVEEIFADHYDDFFDTALALSDVGTGPDRP